MISIAKLTRMFELEFATSILEKAADGPLDPDDVKYVKELVKQGMTSRNLPYPLKKNPYEKHEKKSDWAWPRPREPEPKGKLPDYVEEYDETK